jgi:hypothetical protein
MPEANAAPAEKAPAQKVINELKVSGHLMTLDPGLFCIVQMPSRSSEPGSGLPGVRISHSPGPSGRPEAVSISTFRPDGWLLSGGDAALVRVLGGPAQVLVTIYQSPLGKDTAPSLQVLRLLEPIPTAPAAPGPAARRPAVPGTAPVAAPVPAGAAPTVMEMVAHIQERGDVGAMLGDWLGEKGSKRWIEGFGVAPTRLIGPKDIEYQAVLGRGWLSPWVEGGQFCGSRGMALPILGLRLRLRGAAAEAFDVTYSATFTDGTEVGPVGPGEECEADSLAPIEAFQILVRPRAAGAQPLAAPTPAIDAPKPDEDVAAVVRAKPAKPAAPAGGRKPAGPARRR